MNKGLSESLKEAFPNTENFPRPLIGLQKIPTPPYWLAGFATGSLAERSTFLAERSTFHYTTEQPTLR